MAFPVENLDLSPCVLDPESRRSAQYDLYAVSQSILAGWAAGIIPPRRKTTTLVCGTV